ncbi:hypothetical protein CMV_002484 [Castanea mollissima]|uniref:Uncharacterized protein n=1 Tax=Castanea mollissima TaxID=60419 RepID=A0A8J4W3N1_9ROSI|nr:hypothetical protein CMV_002484 [Castanea mollissima]
MNGVKPKRSGRGDDCCEPLPQSVGQIGYAIVPMIARGIMLGPNQPMILHLLDIKQATESLNAIRMEMTDPDFPLLKSMSLILRANSRCGCYHRRC